MASHRLFIIIINAYAINELDGRVLWRVMFIS